MKIRISKNSLRYRLTRSEVERFATEGIIEETVLIGGTALTYILYRETIETPVVTYADNVIKFTVPELTAHNWTNTESVGFNHTDQHGLFLLVEKDFVCLDNVAEDQSDNYPNPLAAK
jgi:hypothetical protein